MIIKLHGTSGAGKTTVARALLQRGPVTMLPKWGTKPEGYEVQAGFSAPLYVLGPYDAVCGGLDGISDAKNHYQLLDKYGPMGHVFYEGLLQSGFYGTIGQASEKFGDTHVFAFLDTPLDVCIERVLARRAARGDTRPFNPQSTKDKHHAMMRLRERLLTTLNRRVVDINYLDPMPQILELYNEA